MTFEMMLMKCPFYTEILPGLFVGNAHTALNTSLLHRLGIKRILSVVEDSSERPTRLSLEGTGIEQKCFPIDDAPFKDEKKVIESDFLPWIADSLTHQLPILVHCGMGVSRSPAMVMSYLVWTGHSMEEAVRLIEKHRAAGTPPLIMTSFLNAIGRELPQWYEEWAWSRLEIRREPW